VWYVWGSYRSSVLDVHLFCSTDYQNAIDLLCLAGAPALATFCAFASTLCTYCQFAYWIDLPLLCNQRVPNCRVCPDFGCLRNPQCVG
jgi:hypothetical protein